MSSIEEIRAETIRRQSERRSPAPMIAGAAAAFFAGALLVMGWGVLPSLIGKGGADVSLGVGKLASIFAASAKRVGHAEAAPILRACMPRQKLGLDPDAGAEPGDLYRILKAGSFVSRLSALGGQPQRVADPLGLAILWGDVADCVYRQNGRALCDADNRALAVEAANTFVRQLRISSAPQTGDAVASTFAAVQGNGRVRSAVYEVQALHAVAERMLSALRNRVEEGRLIAADFGFSAAPEVKNILGETATTRNACAEEGR